MHHKLKGFTLIELAFVCLLIGFIALACGTVVHTIKVYDRIDDIGYKYKIHITIADKESYYYTDSFEFVDDSDSIKFTDKMTEKTYIASQYFIEFN